MTRAGWTAALLTMGLAAAAHAAMPSELTVGGDGRCPAPAAVAQALGKLHPRLRVGVGEPVDVYDRGAAYEVRARGEVRLVADEARRCGKRALGAALALTLLLDPPAQPPGPPSAPPSATPPYPAAADLPPLVVQPRPRPVPPAHRATIDLELAGLGGGAPALDASGGASLRLAVAWRYLGVTLGAAGLAPVHPRVGASVVTLVRVPIDLDLRATWLLGRLDFGADAGLVVAPLRLSAALPGGPSSAARLDAGARFSPFVHVWLTARLALLAAVECDVSFIPYAVQLASDGTRADLPRVWLWGLVGLVARL